MVIYHLSDLHIGMKLVGRDMMEDQMYVFHQVVEHARTEKPDAIVIAGDIYDKAIPSAEAARLFDMFITSLAEAVPHAEIMIISGNHDSSIRVNQYRSLLSSRHIHMIGMPPVEEEEFIENVTLEDEFGPVHFYLLPFVKPSMERRLLSQDGDSDSLTYEETVRRLLAREDIRQKDRNVLVSHQFYLPRGQNPEDVERADSEIRTVGNIDEIPSDVLDPFDYVALGHIHRPMKVGRDTCRYSGAPLATSISEAGQKKGILRVHMGRKGHVEVSTVPLQPLHEVLVKRGVLEEILREPSDEYVSVTITDPEDLDVTDMQDRLRDAFSNLLEIRRDVPYGRVDVDVVEEADRELDAFSLIESFLGQNLTEEEEVILREAVEKAQGGDEV